MDEILLGFKACKFVENMTIWRLSLKILTCRNYGRISSTRFSESTLAYNTGPMFLFQFWEEKSVRHTWVNIVTVYSIYIKLNISYLQVFFTRNGRIVGIRQVRVPKGGFFPTIGMLSVEEKVRVDLRPLSG